MIDVQTLWQRVNQDLIKLGQTGFDSNESFNRDMNEAELVMLDYHHRMYGLSQNLSDAVNPFVKKQEVQIVSGFVSEPSDYAHRLDMEYKVVVNTALEPTVSYTPMNIEKVGENRSLSAIRRPTITDTDTYSYRQESGGFYVLPPELTGYVRITYLRYPISGSRAVTVASDQEVYDSGNSVNLEWPATELSNFVDLMLFFRGISVRANEVVQWVAANKQIKETIK